MLLGFGSALTLPAAPRYRSSPLPSLSPPPQADPLGAVPTALARSRPRSPPRGQTLQE